MPSRPSFAVRGLQALIHGYRLVISPWIGPRCRFLPTCSDYALDALARHGAIRGSWLTVRRLLRCHPFGGSGFDPVPGDGAVSKQPPGSGGEQFSDHRRFGPEA